LQPAYVGLIPGFASRLLGVTAHANSLGSVACALLILEAAEPSKRRWLNACIVTAAGVALIMTQSKTSILTALLGLVIIWGTRMGADISDKNNRNRSKNGSLIAIGLLVIFCVSTAVFGAWAMFSEGHLMASLESKLNARAVGDLSTGTGRLWIWTAAIKGGLENPLFGQGADFWNLHNRLRLGLSGAVTAHNLYLQVFSRSGFVGLAALLAFLFFLIRYAVRAAKVTGGGSIALITVLLVRAMTEVPISPNSVLGAEFFATMAYFFYVIDRGAKPIRQMVSPPYLAFQAKRGATC
jgi:exopolysaccharide production protein ExoQ